MKYMIQKCSSSQNPKDTLYGVRSGQFAGQSGTGTPQLTSNQGPSPPGRWNQYLHKAGQQKEAWSARKTPGRRLTYDLIDHRTPTPAYDNDPKPSLTVERHWSSNSLDFVHLHSSSRLSELDFQKCAFIWEEHFGPLSNSSVLVIFSCSPLL